jgi:hypothetical protein
MNVLLIDSMNNPNPIIALINRLHREGRIPEAIRFSRESGTRYEVNVQCSDNYEEYIPWMGDSWGVQTVADYLQYTYYLKGLSLTILYNGELLGICC